MDTAISMSRARLQAVEWRSHGDVDTAFTRFKCGGKGIEVLWELSGRGEEVFIWQNPRYSPALYLMRKYHFIILDTYRGKIQP